MTKITTLQRANDARHFFITILVHIGKFDRSVEPDMASQRRWYMPSTLHRMIVSHY